MSGEREAEQIAAFPLLEEITVTATMPKRECADKRRAVVLCSAVRRGSQTAGMEQSIVSVVVARVEVVLFIAACVVLVWMGSLTGSGSSSAATAADRAQSSHVLR